MKGAPAASGARAFSRSPSPVAAHPFLPRTPVVSAVTNSYNLSTMPPPPPPWAPDEHLRFLDALEHFGGQHQQQPQQETWHAITQAVRTRSLEEVRAHASSYFVELQRVNAQRRNEHLAMQAIDARWTLEEDALFEHLLAVDAGVTESACFPWELVAAKLPNKSPRDVQDRYHKLCYDIARIESGHHVAMNLGGRGFLRVRTDADAPEAAPARSWDCAVTLTADEEAILMHALQLVHVSPDVPPQVLANIAAAMAVLTNEHHKIPPQRATAQFTLDEARAVFEELLAQHEHHEQQQRDNQERDFDERLADPRPVLEVLVRRLRLLPQHSGGLDNQQHELLNASRQLGHPLRPLATAGFAFGDAPLYPTMQFAGGVANPKADFSQRGVVVEDLLSFRRQPPHAGSVSTDAIQARTQALAFSPPASGSFAHPSMAPFSPHLLPPHPPHPPSSRPGSTGARSDDHNDSTEEIRESEPPPASSPPRF